MVLSRIGEVCEFWAISRSGVVLDWLVERGIVIVCGWCIFPVVNFVGCLKQAGWFAGQGGNLFYGNGVGCSIGGRPLIHMMRHLEPLDTIPCQLV